MKKLLGVIALVMVLGALVPSQVQAQVPEHQESITIDGTLFSISYFPGEPGAPGTIQFNFATGTNVFTATVGATKAEVLRLLNGNPYYLDLLEAAGLIAWAGDPPTLIPGPNLTGAPAPEPTPAEGG